MRWLQYSPGLPIRRVTLGVLVAALGCATRPSSTGASTSSRAHRSSRDQPGVDHARRVASSYRIECDPGTKEVELSRPGRFERVCMADGVRHGPSVEVYASDPHDVQISLATFVDGRREGMSTRMNFDRPLGGGPDMTRHRVTWREGEVVASTSHVRQDDVWSKQSEFALDEKERLVVVHNERDGIRLDGEMPGGTGTFRIVDGEEVVRAGGECRQGLRHGSWIEYDANGERIRLRTYVDGWLHGPQRLGSTGGEAREGRRVGDWTVAIEQHCTRPGELGERCGHVPCEARVAAGIAHLHYGDASDPDLVDVEWDPDSRVAERDTSDVVFMPAETQQEPASCKVLARWLGRPELP